MSQTPPPTIAPAPAPIQRSDRTTFSDRLDAFILWLTGAVTSFGNVATNAYNNAVDCYNNAVAAASSASTASAAAGTATQTANATMWASGTTYAIGDNRISLVNFQTYRRKTAGAGTTDPSNDATNWARVIATPTPTAVNTQTSAANVALTNTSAGLQAIAMTALGKSVTLPDATTLPVGGPLFVIRNSGSYAFGVRDNAGTLLVGVAPGGTAYLSLESSATAAGTWSINGSSLEPGLVTLDQTLSTTYAGTVYAPFVALDANTSLHFAALSSGFAAFIVDNTGKAVGTPVTVSSVAGSAPRAAFKTGAGQVIVFFGASASDHQAVVLTATGTSIAVGAAAALTYADSFGSWSGEDSKGVPKIAQLSSTLFAAILTSSTPATSAVAISVSGSTVTIGTAITINGSSASTLQIYALTATTALAGFGNSLSVAVVTVTGTTCTVGASVACPVTIAGSAPSLCVLSATKAIAIGSSGNTTAAACTISGTSVTWGAALTMDAGTASDVTSAANGATRYNPRLYPLGTNSALLWYDQSSGAAASIACVLTESAGTLTKGATLYGSFCSAASGASGYGALAMQTPTDFLAITQHGAAGAWRKLAVPHKINGTTITYGNGHALPELSPAVQADAVPSVRLSQGDYLLFSPNSSSLPVLRSNGDALARRGTVSLPNLGGPTAYPLAAVSSNRLLLAATTAGSAASGAQQLRILNIEVAA